VEILTKGKVEEIEERNEVVGNKVEEIKVRTEETRNKSVLIEVKL